MVCADDKTTTIPDGCAIVTVSDKVAAHLMLKGIIDAAKEVEKLEKKRIQLKNQYDKLIKAQQMQGYDTKVPEDIRQANAEKSHFKIHLAEDDGRALIRLELVACRRMVRASSCRSRWSIPMKASLASVRV